MSEERVWHVRSGAINEVVRAKDQWAAWEGFRNRPAGDFGLLATAEPDENGDPLLVRVSALMFAWGRDDDAHEFVRAAVARGLPDTTNVDEKRSPR